MQKHEYLEEPDGPVCWNPKCERGQKKGYYEQQRKWRTSMKSRKNASLISPGQAVVSTVECAPHLALHFR